MAIGDYDNGFVPKGNTAPTYNSDLFAVKITAGRSLFIRNNPLKEGTTLSDMALLGISSTIRFATLRSASLHIFILTATRIKPFLESKPW